MTASRSATATALASGEAASLYREQTIRFPKWWLVQEGSQRIEPPRKDTPDPAAFGGGDSLTGSNGILYRNGKVVRAWEDTDRARWNGRFCTHGVGMGCAKCKDELRAEKMGGSTTGHCEAVAP